MFAKFVVFFALVALATAGDFSSFTYGVADPYTGDYKTEIESHAGDNVRGQYSLLESDGTHCTVDYAADEGRFNAVVRKDPAVIAALVVTAPAIFPAPALLSASPAFPVPAYGYSYGYPYAYRL